MTLIACKEIELPLVFIATKAESQEYEKTFIELAQRIRRHPTILVTDHLPNQTFGNLNIIKMPNGERLSTRCLQSAYQNARIHIHPAFYELPGYTYLESVFCHTPTLATRWASIAEYLSLNGTSPYVQGLVDYAVPYHIRDLRQKTLSLLNAKPAKKESLHIFQRTSLDVAKELIEKVYETLIR